MPIPGRHDQAIATLRQVLSSLRPRTSTYDQIVAPRDQVLARYQPDFSLENLAALTAEEFRSFLYINNNRQWTGLYCLGGQA